MYGSSELNPSATRRKYNMTAQRTRTECSALPSKLVSQLQSLDKNPYLFAHTPPPEIEGNNIKRQTSKRLTAGFDIHTVPAYFY